MAVNQSAGVSQRDNESACVLRGGGGVDSTLSKDKGMMLIQYLPWACIAFLGRSGIQVKVVLNKCDLCER